MPQCPVKLALLASSILIAALTRFDGKVKGLAAQLSPKFYDGYARLPPLRIQHQKPTQKFRRKRPIRATDSPLAAGNLLIIPFRRARVPEFLPRKAALDGEGVVMTTDRRADSAVDLIDGMRPDDSRRKSAVHIRSENRL